MLAHLTAEAAAVPGSNLYESDPVILLTISVNYCGRSIVDSNGYNLPFNINMCPLGKIVEKGLFGTS